MRVSSSVRTTITEGLGTPEERMLLRETLAHAYTDENGVGKLKYSEVCGDDIFAIVSMKGLEVFLKINTTREWIITVGMDSKCPEQVQPLLDHFLQVYKVAEGGYLPDYQN